MNKLIDASQAERIIERIRDSHSTVSETDVSDMLDRIFGGESSEPAFPSQTVNLPKGIVWYDVDSVDDTIDGAKAVAIAKTGEIAYSDDGINWTITNNPLQVNGLSGIRFIGGNYVGDPHYWIAVNPVNNRLIISLNGKSFSVSRSNPAFQSGIMRIENEMDGILYTSSSAYGRNDSKKFNSWDYISGGGYGRIAWSGFRWICPVNHDTVDYSIAITTRNAYDFGTTEYTVKYDEFKHAYSCLSTIDNLLVVLTDTGIAFGNLDPYNLDKTAGKMTNMSMIKLTYDHTISDLYRFGQEVLCIIDGTKYCMISSADGKPTITKTISALPKHPNNKRWVNFGDTRLGKFGDNLKGILFSEDETIATFNGSDFVIATNTL